MDEYWKEEDTMMNTPPNDATAMKQAEQPTQQTADYVNAPSDNQPHSAVLAIADEYINKYRPLWQALAK